VRAEFTAHVVCRGGVQAEAVCRALRVNPLRGVSSDEADMAARKAAFGENTYPPPPSKTWFAK